MVSNSNQIDAISRIMGNKADEKHGRIMSFGKYTGHHLSEIPSQYLKWGVNNFDDVLLVNEIEMELERRAR